MRNVHAAANLVDARLLRHALERSAIPAFVRAEALAGGIGELPPIGLVSVSVPDSAWEQAQDIIDMLGFGSKPGDEQGAIEPWSVECPV